MELIIAPHPIFKKVAQKVDLFDAVLKEKCDQMTQIMLAYNGVGIGANMVGLLERIIIAPDPDQKDAPPIPMINPEITFFSEEKTRHVEASLSYPFISAPIERPNKIQFSYQTLFGEQRHNTAEDFMAKIIQHEIDYLNGIVFLDYLPRYKAQQLFSKMQKAKQNQ